MTFPPEIVERIFIFVLHSTPDAHEAYRCLHHISRVCRLWYLVANSKAADGILWQHIARRLSPGLPEDSSHAMCGVNRNITNASHMPWRGMCRCYFMWRQAFQTSNVSELVHRVVQGQLTVPTNFRDALRGQQLCLSEFEKQVTALLPRATSEFRYANNLKVPAGTRLLAGSSRVMDFCAYGHPKVSNSDLNSLHALQGASERIPIVMPIGDLRDQIGGQVYLVSSQGDWTPLLHPRAEEESALLASQRGLHLLVHQKQTDRGVTQHIVYQPQSDGSFRAWNLGETHPSFVTSYRTRIYFRHQNEFNRSVLTCVESSGADQPARRIWQVEVFGFPRRMEANSKVLVCLMPLDYGHYFFLILNAQTGQPIRQLRSPLFRMTNAFCLTDTHLLVDLPMGAVAVYDLFRDGHESWYVLPYIQDTNYRHVHISVSPCGRFVIAWTAMNEVTVWDMVRRKVCLAGNLNSAVVGLRRKYVRDVKGVWMVYRDIPDRGDAEQENGRVKRQRRCVTERQEVGHQIAFFPTPTSSERSTTNSN